MFGVNGWEALVLLLLVLIVVGPDRLPEVARQVAGWLRSVRDFLQGAKESVKRELGDDVDLASLDPRQYDPRRIVRDALFEDTPSRGRGGSSPVSAPKMWEQGPAPHPGTSEAAPFDEDAT
nr:Sec-independent protein translocase TatB [Actinomycetales bacterium]